MTEHKPFIFNLGSGDNTILDKPIQKTDIILTPIINYPSISLGYHYFIHRTKESMGRTKNIAEKYIQSLSKEIKTKFITVRFGNVLGSNGSVVPLFQKQIQQGGPVTITDPKMTRFFMLIPEAVQLILQAITIGARREVFLLDMGKPVRIVDLADNMIKLAGYAPDKDIKIEFSGIRPGEKLHEELTHNQEELVETGHKKISLVKSRILLQNDFLLKLDELISSVDSADPEKMKLLLKQLASSPHHLGKMVSPN